MWSSGPGPDSVPFGVIVVEASWARLVVSADGRGGPVRREQSTPAGLDGSRSAVW
jgi:hypothetical protein